MHTIADFRSDTVTRPTPAMRRAMAEAEVDDDVLGHDPTTLALEQEAARLLGKESALFVPSGVMANLVAVTTHCRPGEEVILEEWAHTSRFESGGIGALAHVLSRTLRSNRGLMDADEIVRWISPGNEHTPRTALVCVEQTHNFHGGAVLPIEGLRNIFHACRRLGVPVHMDGARMWNAVAASRFSAAEYAACADTVSFCLSKGLCAPVGSLLCGPADFLAKARFVRKRVGGGMRQSGILAAAGLVALREMRERLSEDHARARRIAERVATLPGFAVDLAAVQTNIVFVRLQKLDPVQVVESAAGSRIRLYATGKDQIRFVTHHDVDDDDVTRLLEFLERLSGLKDPMRIFEPHAHMYCRLTDDYERMAIAGITTIQEPAFWLGTERTHPESFYDYFEHITVFERKRAEKYGIRHYQSIGVNPKDAENLEVTLPTVKGMRRFFDRPSVIGVGEIGLNNNTANEMIGLEAQLDLAMELKLPALVHTPHVDKRKGVEMIKGLIEKRTDYDRDLILIDHITEETIEIVRGMGVWVAMTVYPFSKLSPERAVAMVVKYGLEKIMVNSSVDWGESDPLSVPKVVRLMRREGWKERDIERLVWKNPVRFWAQSGRLAETEVVE